MQIKELLAEQTGIAPGATTGTVGTTGTTGTTGTSGTPTTTAKTTTSQPPQAQPITPDLMSKALVPMGVMIKPTATPVIRQYLTKVGAKTDIVKKTGDVYADTILTLFGYHLK